jgi:hypothetical protein
MLKLSGMVDRSRGTAHALTAGWEIEMASIKAAASIIVTNVFFLVPLCVHMGSFIGILLIVQFN